MRRRCLRGRGLGPRSRPSNVELDRQLGRLGGTDQCDLEREGSEIGRARFAHDLEPPGIGEPGKRCVTGRPPHVLDRERHPVSVSDRDRMNDGYRGGRRRREDRPGGQEGEHDEKCGADDLSRHSDLFGRNAAGLSKLWRRCRNRCPGYSRTRQTQLASTDCPRALPCPRRSQRSTGPLGELFAKPSFPSPSFSSPRGGLRGGSGSENRQEKSRVKRSYKTNT
jgi:hypothetical protein